jgi:hypothetical protein
MHDMQNHVLIRRIASICLLGIFLAAVMLPGASGAKTVTATIGSEVRLSGAAAGSDTIYLFLTGPNLASNGVRLDNIRSQVVTGNPGSFTRVVVMGSTWSYRWNTRTAGGTPDAGTYTVYAVRLPNGRQDLAGVDYETITVVLAAGGIETITTGSILVTTIPAGAHVLLDGKEKGTTPVTIRNLDPGTYTVVLQADNFTPIEETVQVETGRTTNLTRKLKQPTPVPTALPTPLPPASPRPTQSAGAGWVVAGGVIGAWLLWRR